MARKSRNRNVTKAEIIRTATNFFLEKGYSKTSPRIMCDELNISPGTLTYYFKKEELLALIIEMLAEFQWQTFQDIVNDGETPITALCLELTAIAAMCEDDAVARDLYLSAYTNEVSLDVIRQSDMKRAKSIFAETCRDWTDEQFAEAETIVSGIEYATLMVTKGSPPLAARIKGAMNSILALYGISEERRNKKIDMALSMDYHLYGKKILEDFKEYVHQRTDQLFDF